VVDRASVAHDAAEGSDWSREPSISNDGRCVAFGIDPIHRRYCQNSEPPHLEVRRRISDHCPVWAEFDASKADDD